MKNVFIAAAVAVAGLAAYFMIRKRNRRNPEVTQKTHHLTNAFSRAKEYAVDH